MNVDKLPTRVNGNTKPYIILRPKNVVCKTTYNVLRPKNIDLYIKTHIIIRMWCDAEA